MIKTIKGKITLGAGITSVITLVIINLIIWQVFQNNLKTFIKEDMDKTKSIAVSEIKNLYLMDEDLFKGSSNNELWRTLNNISRQHEVYISMDYDREVNIEFIGTLLNDEERKNILQDSNKKTSLLYISKGNITSEQRGFYGTFAYPMYIEMNYIGTLVFQKDYLKQYEDYTNLIERVIAIEGALFLIMVFVVYLLLKNTTKPLATLKANMAHIGEGDFSHRLEVKRNDEISSLIKHFNSMQHKIIGQMEQLHSEKKKIEELERSSREFFDYATHELKTPLTAIIGYGELLQKGNLKEEDKKRAYERIKLEGNRLKTMVQNMLVVAKGRKEESKIQEGFSITEVLKEIIDEYNLIFEKIGIQIGLKEEELIVQGVKEELRTVILNLIDNGVKYSLDGRVNIGVNGNEGIIIIENRCGAIPMEVKENLFKPFVKYNYGDNTKVSSGLGLFICKELMEKNNGTIEYTVSDEKIKFILTFMRDNI